MIPSKKKPKNQGLLSMASSSSNRRAVSKKVAGPGAGGIHLESWIGLGFTEQYTDRRMLWGEVNPKGWRPHAMGQPCDRISVLSMFGYRGGPIALKLKRIFDLGHVVEAQWRTYFTQMGLLISSNQKVFHKADPVISGEYDVLIRHLSEPDRRLLGDIKSINNNGFSKLPPVTIDPVRNQEALMNLKGTQLYARCRCYVMQLQVYLRLAGVEEGFILFSNKDNSDFADYCLVQDPAMVDAEFERLRHRDTYRERLVVPPCSCPKPPKKPAGESYEMCWFKSSEEIPLDVFKKVTEDLGLK